MARTQKTAGRPGKARAASVSPLLRKAFEVVCFDWLGTAVPDLTTDASSVRSRVEHLASLGVDVVVLSTAGLEAVDGQLRARPDVGGRLFLLLSGGAEVYEVGSAGPRLIERRQADQREWAGLERAGEAVLAAFAERGLEAGLAGEGPTWRALDLLPGRRGPRPGNREALRRAVSERAADAGMAGVGEALALAARVAHHAGLHAPRVSFDGRRVVVALTDKSDSMRWMHRWVVDSHDYDVRKVLVVGDRFGDWDGVPGNDAALLTPDLKGATFVSVGDEPGAGVKGVRLVGGGPARLLELLDAQIALRVTGALASFPAPDADQDWLFSVEGFDPFREREVETWMTVANGETGTRGALEEGSPASTPGTFVAGVYGDGTSEPRIRQPVPAPDWLCLRLLVDGMPLSLANGEILEHRRVLDLRQGVVFRHWRQRDRVGRSVRVRTARFASLADRAVLGLRAEATPEDFCGRLNWEACVGVSYAGGPVYDATFESLDGAGFVARTRGRRGGGHALAVSTRPAPGSPVARYIERSRDVIGGRLECEEPATVDRLGAVVSSSTRVPDGETATRVLAKAEELGFDELLRRHRAAWQERWADAALSIDGDDQARLALRFSIYHMIASAHPGKDAVSIGARGLSGMSYFQHVFWDTEIFVVPFFIYTHPETARTLLAYRHRNLDGARRKARDLGHRGALFPWESADRGEETTPPYGMGPRGEMVPILSGLLEHHISADVAWAVWEYWKATGDDAFMVEMGTELLLETARFWVSRASRDESGGYHIPMVVGPDEYHEGVDDNAYTNVLARFNIRRALEAMDWLERADPAAAAGLLERTGLDAAEQTQWAAVADRLVDGFDPETRLFEQFAGFYGMADVDPAALAQRPMAADLMLGREVTLRSKVVKQADVVMLCYLLPDEIDGRTARANLDYYEPITSHGSSLSPGIHAALAARLGKLDVAADAFRMAAEIDLSDNMGNAASGLHLATMGGLWQAAVMGFGGIRRHGETLVVDPHLPKAWRGLDFRLRFRGARLGFRIGHDEFEVEVGERTGTLVIGRRQRRLDPGTYRFRRARGGAWEESA